MGRPEHPHTHTHTTPLSCSINIHTHPPIRLPTGSAAPSMLSSSGSDASMTELPEPHAAAWAVLLDSTASLLAPLLRMRDLFALSLVCKGLRPTWRQLCDMDPLDNRVIDHLLSSGTYRATAIDMSTFNKGTAYTSATHPIAQSHRASGPHGAPTQPSWGSQEPWNVKSST